MARNPFRRRREPPLTSLTAAAQSAGTMASTMLQSLQQPWQSRARLFSKRLGIVAFAHEITTSVGSRCRFVVQENVGGDNWREATSLGFVLDWYRNEHQSFSELISAHLYRVGCDGDRYEVLSDAPDGGSNYWVVPINTVQWQGATVARVMLAPNGNDQDGTSLVLEADRLVRMWTPDRDHPLLATSPMAAVVEDCESYWHLRKFVRRTANSRLAMNKMLWTPEGAHIPLPDDMQTGGITPTSQLDIQLAKAAQSSFDREDTVQGIMPFILRWDKELGEPKLIDLARGLEPAILAAMQDAARAIAAGLPMPAQLLLGESQNHWGDWMLDELGFRWGVAPPLERVCNDLTQSFLTPTLRALAPSDPAITDPSNFRIWYDPSAVIIHPDRTANALPLNLAGLLSSIPTLEAYGFGAAELMGEVEREALKAFRAQPPAGGGFGGAPELPAGPGSITEGPPPVPAAVGSLGPFDAELLSYYRGN